MIKEISIKDITEHYISAKKSGLVFCKSTTMYGLFIGNQLVAFTGIIVTPKKAIFKNHFVPVKYRGKGYFQILLDFSIMIATELKIKTIEATCTEMSLPEYHKRGFLDVKKYKKYTKVKYENI